MTALAPGTYRLGAPRRVSGYQALINRALAKQSLIPDVDPRWVEAWIRVDHPSLEHLNIQQFEAEIVVALDCVMASTARENEQLALSVGL